MEDSSWQVTNVPRTAERVLACGGADMTWQVTKSCGTEPPSRHHCRNYPAGRTRWCGAGSRLQHQANTYRELTTEQQQQRVPN